MGGETRGTMLSAWVCSLVMSASGPSEAPTEKPPVPWYLPQSASLGFFFNREVWSPHLRLQWEFTVLDQPRNALALMVSLGSGLAANTPNPMTAHFQHVGLLGVAFRSDRERLHWGFHATFGGVWYRAAYKPNPNYIFENRVLPYGEGRVQAGVFVAPHVRLALYLGYGAPFIYTNNRPGNLLVGGFAFGVVVDWR